MSIKRRLDKLEEINGGGLALLVVTNFSENEKGNALYEWRKMHKGKEPAQIIFVITGISG